jgi:hypothetical protein
MAVYKSPFVDEIILLNTCMLLITWVIAYQIYWVLDEFKTILGIHTFIITRKRGEGAKTS